MWLNPIPKKSNVATKLQQTKKPEKDSNLKIIQNVYKTKLGERRFEDLTDDEFLANYFNSKF